MRYFRHGVWAVCLTAVTTVAVAQAQPAEDKTAPCIDVVQWRDINQVSMKVGSPDAEERMEWTLAYHDNNDILIRVARCNEDGTQPCTIGMISGQVMITQGVSLEPGYEIDALDMPLLMTGMLVRILQRIAPGGMASVARNMTVDHQERHYQICVATASAKLKHPPPWSVSGMLEAQSPQKIAYDLRFQREQGGRQVALILSGTAAHDDSLRGLDDTMSLQDWQVYTTGVIQRKVKGGTIVDFGAQPLQPSFATVAEVRAYIKQRAAGKKQSGESGQPAEKQ